MPLVQGCRIQELRELGRRAKLGKLGVQFRRDDHRAQEIGVHTRHHRAAATSQLLVSSTHRMMASGEAILDMTSCSTSLHIVAACKNPPP